MTRYMAAEISLSIAIPALSAMMLGLQQQIAKSFP
jgi:hypothetical protein